MKRKLLLFAGVLFLMLALKYAFGQETGGTAELDTAGVYEDPTESVIGLAIAAPLLGMVFGAFRVLAKRSQRPVLEPMRLR